MTWFEQGATHVDWWNLHNGTDQAPTTVHGQTDYQDGGVLSAGTCAGGKCEPSRDTPFPIYWGIRSLTALAQPGDTIVKSSSGNSSVTVHAVRSGNGGLNVMLTNKSPENAAQVSLSYAGFTPAAGAVTTVSYGQGRHRPDDGEAGHGGRTDAAAVLDHDSSAEARVGDCRADKPSPVPTKTAAPAAPAGCLRRSARPAPGRRRRRRSAPHPPASRPRAARPATWLPPGRAALSRTAASVACWSSLSAACWRFADVAAGLCTGSETA